MGFKVIRTGDLISSISEVKGRLCLHLQGKGLFFADDTILTPFLVQPEISNKQIHFCKTLRDSSLLIGTASNGLYQFKGDEMTALPGIMDPLFFRE